jgi:ABC-type glycerol-3-phosphate transport system permease component
LSIAIQPYNVLYATRPTQIQAASPMTMAVPVVVFLKAQRAFMHGVLVTDVEK